MTTPACTTANPALFDSTDLIDHHTARRFCDTCPVVAACLQRALAIAGEHAADQRAARGPDGTWAGLLWRDGHVVTRSDLNARGAAAAQRFARRESA